MKILLTPEGTANYVYRDSIKNLPLGDAINIKRATEVEFNTELGLWEARDLRSGNIIAQNKSRDQVIKEEVDTLEKEMVTDGRSFVHRNR